MRPGQLLFRARLVYTNEKIQRDRRKEFTAELKAPGTAASEKLLALKFLIHFVGDLHQPLHASDDMDKGGNCIALKTSIGGSNFNSFNCSPATIRTPASGNNVYLSPSATGTVANTQPNAPCNLNGYGAALPFDEHYRPKPAVAAIVKAFTDKAP